LNTKSNNSTEPRAIWITGLPGSGKTTLAQSLQRIMDESGRPTILLDGDQLRDALGVIGNYSFEERKALSEKYQKIGKLIYLQGYSVIFSVVAMFDEIRDSNRRIFNDYVEIFLDVKRDLRIQVRPQLQNESIMENVDSSDYEFPKRPDLILVANYESDRNAWLSETLKYLGLKIEH
jgi:adenylylsulfate kinase